MSTNVDADNDGSNANASAKKPDWRYWLDMPNLQIKDIVSLSMNMHPSSYKDMEASISKCQLQKWRERLSIAIRHAENEKLTTTKDGPIHWQLSDRIDTEQSEVDLVEFVQWSQSLNFPWDLPAELMSLSATEQVAKDDELSINDTLKVIATLLKLIQANGRSYNQSWVSDIIAESETYKIKGIGRRKLNGIFASANKELKK